MNKGYNNTVAIVLDTIDYSESDKIVTFHTPGYGRLKGIAKGARRSRRRFVNSMDPFSLVDLVFFHKEGRDLVNITECKLKYPFGKIKEDIQKISYGSYMLEFIREMTRELQDGRKVFGLLLLFLKMLEEEEAPEKVLILFEVRALTVLGYHLALKKCNLCAGIPKGGRQYFSSEHGGIICADCKNKVRSCLPLSMGTAKFLIAASRLDIDKLKRLVPTHGMIKEVWLALVDFVRYQLGKDLKAVRFVEAMNGDTIFISRT